MPRVARIVVPGVPHHVSQRGNNRQQVFFRDEDRGLSVAGAGLRGSQPGAGAGGAAGAALPLVERGGALRRAGPGRTGGPGGLAEAVAAAAGRGDSRGAEKEVTLHLAPQAIRRTGRGTALTDCK